MPTIKLYRFPLSGHSHRVEVFLSLLGLDFELVNLASGVHKQEGFLKKNIFGQVPVIDDGEISIADSNAILIYLATKYDASKTWLPSNPIHLAEVQRFLSLAAGKIAFGPAAARAVNVFGAKNDHQKAMNISHDLLQVLELHLKDRKWLVSDSPSIADVANYTYIAHAPEGDVSLENYPNIQNWLSRFESLSGFVPMISTSVGLVD
ncbi:MAG: glutathione S-transferase [Colwellia sp.]|jgi:glutathione S-transferase